MEFSAIWAVPFVGLLLSIAFFPVLLPTFWHHHFGKISAAWSLSFLLPFALSFGPSETAHQVLHVVLLEYLPFIVILFALYTISGGICVRGNMHATPVVNTGLLALGAFLASWMGTTGAAMLLIRPVIRANDNRTHNVHVIVFFIFLVANAGGALTPLGDPPLFLGFLKGVDFFWTTRNLYQPTLVLCVFLLVAFFVLDTVLYRRGGDEKPPAQDPTPDSAVRLEGKINFLLLGAIVGAVLLSGLWRPGVEISIFGTQLALQNLVRDALLVFIALVSLKITPYTAREGNEFSWGPIIEVAKLFIGIFLTMIPVIAMLKAGVNGPLGSVVSLATDTDGTPDNVMYFWLSGALSSFLDNAPTYLVFFNMAGGNPVDLMGNLKVTLMAISMGAVYMGAMTYIGNAPNFMVKAIAEHQGIKMPSFFAYMAWSIVFLLPPLVLVSWLFISK